MSDAVIADLPGAKAPPRRDIGLKQRYAAERRFRLMGLLAVSVGLVFLAVMLTVIGAKGRTAFMQTSVLLPINFDANLIDLSNKRASDAKVLRNVNSYAKLAQNALQTKLGLSPDDKAQMAAVRSFLSGSASARLRDMTVADPEIIGTTQNVWILVSANIDSAFKGQIDLTVPERSRKVSDMQVGWMKQLETEGVLASKFNRGLFTFADSSRPEASGIGAAALGSLYMMLIVLALALPIGVAASIYLQEFARKTWMTDLIEVNINNLAAVPSIVFGLLGLAAFINFGGLPRSSAIVGGLVLTLMTLPTIIIATRAALAAVPPSIRAAALGLGASRTQTVFHHVLPLATPGIMTGTIIGLARALGETAPLLLIGMVVSVFDYPDTPLDPATALPAQIYLWVNSSERAFVERAPGAIIILLAFLMVMNLTAILVRRRFERRW